MIYLEYLLAASIVVILSIKASKYVDLLDKNTMLSGGVSWRDSAFCGDIASGVFTSISATIMLDRPGMCMGNILGGNLFNLAELAFLPLFFQNIFKGKSFEKLSSCSSDGASDLRSDRFEFYGSSSFQYLAYFCNFHLNRSDLCCRRQVSCCGGRL